MVTNEKPQIANKVKLADLTVGEFKALLREIVEDVVEQAIFELEQQLPDPDESKELRPEVTEQLRTYLNEKPAEDILKETDPGHHIT